MAIATTKPVWADPAKGEFSNDGNYANDGGWKTGGTFRPTSQRTALAARPDTARTDTPIARELHRVVPGG
jgi:hypothetical protein